ncbi:uncharacterized protein JCM6883_003773 [Sporobolomyces salmoneus]|uniref:uncharacterized protein n=1 Tax=Sporobolomyces salmoneus TaxID=183962 RepID=UPI00316B4549
MVQARVVLSSLQVPSAPTSFDPSTSSNLQVENNNMADQLDRSNTTTSFSSFFGGSRKPSINQPTPTHGRPPPSPNYQHIDDYDPATSNDPPLSFMKLAYPRSRSEDLRASKLGLVEKMSSRERIEKWNEIHANDEENQLTPLERWRLEVAKEVEKERRREEIESKRRQAEEEEKSGVAEGRVASWKPSVLTTSSMRSAAVELQKQFDSSSPFAKSFDVEHLKTPRTAESAPTSSVVRESFLHDSRQPQEDHPYVHTFGFDEATGSLIVAPPRPPPLGDASAQETLLIPTDSPETCASVSPIDPVFASDSYRFPLSLQRHPLPKIDTSVTPVTSTFSNSPVSAPVVSTYQAFVPPPRSSSLPFHDLESIHLSTPSPPHTSIPPPVPPKDVRAPDPSFALLPPKAAALLGLIVTSHPVPVTARPRPPFARDRNGSISSDTPSGSTEQYRSSFYTNYDGPSRPSVDSSTPTTMTSPSTLHRTNKSSLSSLAAVERSQGGGIVNRANRPPPLTFQHRQAGMSSLPDLHESPSLAMSSTSSNHGGSRGEGGSSVSSSLDLSLRGRSSLETPRTIVFQSNPFLYHQSNNSRAHVAESEIESLLDAPLHRDPEPSPPFPLSRFGTSIGQDLSSRDRRNGGDNRGTLKSRASGSNLARSLSQKGKGLARKLSLRNLPKTTTQEVDTGGERGRGVEDEARKNERVVQSRRSFKNLKKELERKVESSFRYW